jgi:hypothetical protein
MMSPAARPASHALIAFRGSGLVALRTLIPLQAIGSRLADGGGELAVKP